MSYRFTNTDKWGDAWFANLKPIEKLLFMYLTDNCDIAGFIEINFRKWAAEIDTDRSIIEEAFKGLARGYIISSDGDCIFIRNYLKHQKNLPLNENNKMHQGIIARFNLYLHKFECQYVDDLINRGLQGACKGLSSPTGKGNGNGNGNGIGNCKEKEGDENFENDHHSKKTPEELLEKRRSDFYQSLVPYVGKYTKEMIKAFYEYWSEANKSKTRMRYEMQPVFELSKRLATWASKDNSYNRQLPQRDAITVVGNKDFDISKF